MAFIYLLKCCFIQVTLHLFFPYFPYVKWKTSVLQLGGFFIWRMFKLSTTIKNVISCASLAESLIF